ncbi:sulfotransferase [Microbacterium sp. NPDC058345]|uniref:sulfotransferase n=1 Tax=Microbacterium sp. NPDC058345 TaxID=3346455 RepID=UPI003650E4F3
MSETSSGASPRGRSRILVTGMPRSGTTWLARLLAAAPGSALTGREPMNPRGRQWALAGSLDGWSRLSEPSDRQVRALRRAYRALSPSVYSRYGTRQWLAALPWTRLIVKDPFAMLSIPAIHSVTGARPVLIHRHPGAMLVSYRRMRWVPDIEEMTPIVAAFERTNPDLAARIPCLPTDAPADGALAMGWFWSSLYVMALSDLESIPGGVVVPHELVATDMESCRLLHERLDVPWSPAAEAEFLREASGQVDPEKLHNFNRRPADAAMAWRGRLPEAEVSEIERATASVRSLLDEAASQLRAG